MTRKDANGFAMLELRIEHEKELRQLSEQNDKLALEKQAAEYERRLSELNHAHEKALQDKAQFLEKALYEASQKDFQVWKLGITEDLASRAAALTADVSKRTEAIQMEADRRALALAKSLRTQGIIVVTISILISAAGVLIGLIRIW